MRTIDEINQAQHAYRHSVAALLGIAGIGHLIPTTEQGWVLFDTNQKLRDLGVGKPLPWPDRHWTEGDVLDILDQAKEAANR